MEKILTLSSIVPGPVIEAFAFLALHLFYSNRKEFSRPSRRIVKLNRKLFDFPVQHSSRRGPTNQ